MRRKFGLNFPNLLKADNTTPKLKESILQGIIEIFSTVPLLRYNGTYLILNC